MTYINCKWYYCVGVILIDNIISVANIRYTVSVMCDFDKMETPKQCSSVEGHQEIEKHNASIPQMLQIKRDGGELSAAQIKSLINAICAGTMEDAQLGAFLMSVYLNGMSGDETASFTMAMKNSGTVFKWPESWRVVDKHSTGGVGDKISLVLAPALASLGLKVPMISGRGLGHTGGTLDKLESIPGLKVSLSEEEMRNCLETVGCCIVGQTETIVPADKKMYAIRDVTSTVPSIPLIVSSIISKKASENPHSLVLDVKFGRGSFMDSQAKAEELAEALVSAGESLGIRTSALVTRMDCPIGMKIGNALEVEEAIECLKGAGPQDLKELVQSLGAELLLSTGIASSHQEGKSQICRVIDDGSALTCFSKMIQAQGVSVEISSKLCSKYDNQDCLPRANLSTLLLSPATGKIIDIDALAIAEVCCSIGAGRTRTSDPINYGVGLILLKSVGEDIAKGTAWAELRHDSELKDVIIQKANEAITVSRTQNKITVQSLVAKRISRRN